MARIDALPCPPSRAPRPRSERIPDSVLRRYEAFLEQVSARRQALRLTQEDVAELVGISKSQFANFERGYSVLSVPKLFVLADALEVTAAELVSTPSQEKKQAIDSSLHRKAHRSRTRAI
jgi:transcriptional regulator with XRE-family HTH domain